MTKRTDYRKEARGRECMIRLECCDGGGETTVLTHFRLLPYCGTGIKPDDLAFGAWACARCHDRVDSRQMNRAEYDVLRLAHAEAVMRTIAQLRKEGKA